MIIKKYIAITIVLCAGYWIFHVPTYPIYENSHIVSEAEDAVQTNQTVIHFNSKNPFNLNDILTKYNTLKDQKVYGILTLPDGDFPSDHQFPLIIGVAGSKDWSEHHYRYLKEYIKMGIATLSLQSFKSRGVTSTVGEQISVTVAMVISDAYAALTTLSEHDAIDIDRVGITGWSLGGGVSLFSAWRPIKDILSPQLAFKTHLPIYPPCMVKPDIMDFTDAPLHILIGEVDDWVPADACVDFIDEMKTSGYDVDITVYPNAHHSFDRAQGEIYDENAYSFTHCRLSLSPEGIVKTTQLEIPLSTPILQKAVLAFCADRGATFGGNEEARNKSTVFAREFMSQHLLNNHK